MNLCLSRRLRYYGLMISGAISDSICILIDIIKEANLKEQMLNMMLIYWCKLIT